MESRDAGMVELLPCPICNAAPRRNGRGVTGGVLCAGDNSVVGMFHRLQTYGVDQAEADTAWNTRAHQPTEAHRQLGGSGIQLLDTDNARVQLWKAICDITIGNRWDDKLIIANLAKQGVYLAVKNAKEISCE